MSARRSRAGAATPRTPPVVLFLFGTALLLAVALAAALLHSASGRSASGAPAQIPALRVLAPAGGDTVRNPVELRFRTDAPLRAGAAGWTADGLHLHLLIDGREVMPAAADIRRNDRDYAWRLPALAAGPQRLWLTWAGADHRNLDAPTDTLHLHVLP